MNKKGRDFQNKMVEKLKSGEMDYGHASIYTILLELVKGNDPQHVFDVFESVCKDYGLDIQK